MKIDSSGYHDPARFTNCEEVEYLMFESITIRRQNHHDAQNPLDLGFLAEALLFYQRVRVIANSAILRQLVLAFGPELLLQYLQEEFLEIMYLENNLMIITPNSGTRVERHDVGIYSVPRLQLQEYAPALLQEATGKRGRGRRLARRMVNEIEPYTHDDEVKVQARQDFDDGEYVIAAAKEILVGYAPEYRLPDPFEFAISGDSGEFSISTNIDFEAANRSYHQRIPPNHSTLTPAYFLNFLVNARSHLLYASRTSTELALESVNASLLQLKISTILKSRVASEAELDLFQDYTLDDSHAIREAINAGERDFRDLFDILQRANKFKNWLTENNPEETLLKQYMREATKGTWIDKLPGKYARWSIMTAVGVAIGPAGVLAGVALSAADAFLFERLIKGWNPSSFINDDLRRFVKKDS